MTARNRDRDPRVRPVRCYTCGFRSWRLPPGSERKDGKTQCIGRWPPCRYCGGELTEATDNGRQIIPARRRPGANVGLRAKLECDPDVRLYREEKARRESRLAPILVELRLRLEAMEPREIRRSKASANGRAKVQLTRRTA